LFVNDRLIYLQLQKTGCTHVANLLAKLIGGRQVGKHNRLPNGLRQSGRIIVGSIRSPWDWYVSLWGFGCDSAGGLAGRLTGTRSLRGHGLMRMPLGYLRSLVNDWARPRSKWAHLYADVRDPRLFREWLAMIHDPRNRFALGEAYAQSPMSAFSGFLTYRYAFLYGADLDSLYSRATGTPERLSGWLARQCRLDCVIRKEHLEEDLISALRRAGIECSDERIRLVRTAGRTNASSRRPELDFYYDAATVALVGDRDRQIVEMYGYCPPRLMS
jgi:hypothetical protein